MKRIVSIFAVLAILLAATVSLASCSGGVSRAEAKEATIALFAALAAENYEEAAALFHPETETTAELLSSFCEAIRADLDVDFTEGVAIERYTGMRSAYYDSTVGGSLYELTMSILVGDKTMTFVTEVVRNDTGYGLWNIHCEE
jgi:hypothetical protein